MRRGLGEAAGMEGAMGWQPAPDSGVDADEAARAGVQAGTFLSQVVHGEIDGAVLDPVEVLLDPRSPGMAVYALSAVQGPLRAYLATAWGRAEHVATKQIVSYPSIEQARQALGTVRAHRMAGHGSDRTYIPVGTFQPDANGQGDRQ
jgi:hypothetical protein